MQTYICHWQFPDQETHMKGTEAFAGFVEGGCQGDEFEGFKVVNRVHAPHALKVFIMCEADGYLSMSKHFAPWKVKFDIDFDIMPVVTDAEKIAEHKMVGEMLSAEG